MPILTEDERAKLLQGLKPSVDKAVITDGGNTKVTTPSISLAPASTSAPVRQGLSGPEQSAAYANSGMSGADQSAAYAPARTRTVAMEPWEVRANEKRQNELFMQGNEAAKTRIMADNGAMAVQGLRGTQEQANIAKAQEGAQVMQGLTGAQNTQARRENIAGDLLKAGAPGSAAIDSFANTGQGFNLNTTGINVPPAHKKPLLVPGRPGLGASNPGVPDRLVGDDGTVTFLPDTAPAVAPTVPKGKIIVQDGKRYMSDGKGGYTEVK